MHFGEGFAINGLGQIVGQNMSVSAQAGTQARAFYWDGGHVWDLAKQTINLGEWVELSSAQAINDAGQIAGYGLINGLTHAFLR